MASADPAPASPARAVVLATSDGRVIWDFDTGRDFQTVKVDGR